MNRPLAASAVAAAFALAAPLTFADSTQPSNESSITVAAAPAADAPGAARPAPERRAFRLPSERVEARLAYVRTALKITDAQQPQWENFANVLRKHARDMDQRIEQRRSEQAEHGGRRGARSVNAIERLESKQQRLQARSTRLGEVLAAAKPLYAALSPEQQQIADSMLARGSGRGGHHHHHRHRSVHRGA